MREKEGERKEQKKERKKEKGEGEREGVANPNPTLFRSCLGDESYSRGQWDT